MKPGDKFTVGDKEYTLKDAIERAGLQLETFFNENETDHNGSFEYELPGDDGETAYGTIHYKAINGVVDPNSLEGSYEYEGNAKVDDDYATQMIQPGGEEHEEALKAAQEDYDYVADRMRSKFGTESNGESVSEDAGDEIAKDKEHNRELDRIKHLSGLGEGAGFNEEDAYDNDRYIIKNGKATIDNSNTPDKKNHVYADSKAEAEKEAKRKGIKEDLSKGDPVSSPMDLLGGYVVKFASKNGYSGKRYYRSEKDAKEFLAKLKADGGNGILTRNEGYKEELADKELSEILNLASI